MAKEFAWSFSPLVRFENCPKQYYEINHMKNFKDEDSDWSKEGKLIHDAMFRRVIKREPLPLPMRPFEKIARRLDPDFVPGERYGEMKMALNRQFEPVTYFASNVYIRAIIDFLIVQKNRALIFDWKTGKIKEDFTQLGMAAAVLSRLMPEIKEFRVVYVWLQHNHLSPMTYELSDFAGMWGKLITRANKIEEAIRTTNFPAKESGLCRFCPVASCAHYSTR